MADKSAAFSIAVEIDRLNLAREDAKIRTTIGKPIGITITPKIKSLNSIKELTGVLQEQNKHIKTAITGMQDFSEKTALAGKRFLAFTAATAVFFKLSSAISEATKEASDFEVELLKVKQVSRESDISIRGLSDEVFSVSKSLGVSSKEILSVGLTLAQAGRSISEIKDALRPLAKTRLAATFGDITDTVDALIAAQEQFGISSQKTESVLGTLNVLSARYAVEADDLTVAIQKAGGAFAAISDLDQGPEERLNQLLSLFTAVRSTSRESADTIATGLRTIFARIRRPETISALEQFGIQLRGVKGELKGPLEAIKEISRVTSQFQPNDIRLSSIIEEVGGIRQQSKVIPLLNQIAKAEEALIVATQGANSLTRDQEIAQVSLRNQLERTKQEFIELVNKGFRSDTFRDFVSQVNFLAKSFISLTEAVGPVLPALVKIAEVQLIKSIPTVGGSIIRELQRTRTGTSIEKKVGAGGPKKAMMGGPIQKFEAGGEYNSLLEPGEYVYSSQRAKKIGRAKLDKQNATGEGFNASGTMSNIGSIYCGEGFVPGKGKGDKVKAYLQEGQYVIRNKAIDNAKERNMPKFKSGGSFGKSSKSDFSFDLNKEEIGRSIKGNEYVSITNNSRNVYSQAGTTQKITNSINGLTSGGSSTLLPDNYEMSESSGLAYSGDNTGRIRKMIPQLRRGLSKGKMLDDLFTYSGIDTLSREKEGESVVSNRGYKQVKSGILEGLSSKKRFYDGGPNLDDSLIQSLLLSNIFQNTESSYKKQPTQAKKPKQGQAYVGRYRLPEIDIKKHKELKEQTKKETKQNFINLPDTQTFKNLKQNNLSDVKTFINTYKPGSLNDISITGSELVNIPGITEKNGLGKVFGAFNKTKKKILVGRGGLDRSTLLHEIGHAIDHTDDGFSSQNATPLSKLVSQTPDDFGVSKKQFGSNKKYYTSPHEKFARLIQSKGLSVPMAQVSGLLKTQKIDGSRKENKLYNKGYRKVFQARAKAIEGDEKASKFLDEVNGRLGVPDSEIDYTKASKLRFIQGGTYQGIPGRQFSQKSERGGNNRKVKEAFEQIGIKAPKQFFDTKRTSEFLERATIENRRGSSSVRDSDVEHYFRKKQEERATTFKLNKATNTVHSEYGYGSQLPVFSTDKHLKIARKRDSYRTTAKNRPETKKQGTKYFESHGMAGKAFDTIKSASGTDIGDTRYDISHSTALENSILTKNTGHFKDEFDKDKEVRQELAYNSIKESRKTDRIYRSIIENSSLNQETKQRAKESLKISKIKTREKIARYRDIQNSTLEASEQYETAKRNIKSFRAQLNKTKLPEDIITYSGLDTVSSGVIDEALGNGKKSGQTFTLQRFLSTTTRKGVAEGFLGSGSHSRGGKTLLRINNFKGQKGAVIGDSEREIFLPNRESFKINKVINGKEYREVFVERLKAGGEKKKKYMVGGRLQSYQDEIEDLNARRGISGLGQDLPLESFSTDILKTKRGRHDLKKFGVPKLQNTRESTVGIDPNKFQNISKSASSSMFGVTGKLVQAISSSKHQADLLSKIPKNSKYLGSGSEGIAYETPDGRVIRIGFHGQHYERAFQYKANKNSYITRKFQERPKSNLVLQPIESQKIDKFQFELLPKATRLHETNKTGKQEERLLKRFSEKAKNENLSPIDIGSDNVGYHNGELKAIDPTALVSSDSPQYLERKTRFNDGGEKSATSVLRQFNKPTRKTIYNYLRTRQEPGKKNTELVHTTDISRFIDFDRKKSQDLPHLLENIRREGIKEPGFLGYHDKTKKVHLSEGNHRLEAAKQLGITVYPVGGFEVKEQRKSPAYSSNRKVIGYDGQRRLDGSIPEFKPSEIGVPSLNTNEGLLKDARKSGLVDKYLKKNMPELKFADGGEFTQEEIKRIRKETKGKSTQVYYKAISELIRSKYPDSIITESKSTNSVYTRLPGALKDIRLSGHQAFVANRPTHVKPKTVKRLPGQLDRAVKESFIESNRHKDVPETTPEEAQKNRQISLTPIAEILKENDTVFNKKQKFNKGGKYIVPPELRKILKSKYPGAVIKEDGITNSILIKLPEQAKPKDVQTNKRRQLDDIKELPKKLELALSDNLEPPKQDKKKNDILFNIDGLDIKNKEVKETSPLFKEKKPKKEKGQPFNERTEILIDRVKRATHKEHKPEKVSNDKLDNILLNIKNFKSGPGVMIDNTREEVVLPNSSGVKINNIINEEQLQSRPKSSKKIQKYLSEIKRGGDSERENDNGIFVTKNFFYNKNKKQKEQKLDGGAIRLVLDNEEEKTDKKDEKKKYFGNINYKNYYTAENGKFAKGGKVNLIKSLVQPEEEDETPQKRDLKINDFSNKHLLKSILSLIKNSNIKIHQSQQNDYKELLSGLNKEHDLSMTGMDIRGKKRAKGKSDILSYYKGGNLGTNAYKAIIDLSDMNLDSIEAGKRRRVSKFSIGKKKKQNQTKQRSLTGTKDSIYSDTPIDEDIVFEELLKNNSIIKKEAQKNKAAQKYKKNDNNVRVMLEPGERVLSKDEVNKHGIDNLRNRNEGYNTLSKKRQNGAFVPGRGSGDKIPATLQEGQFVLRKKYAKGGLVTKFADGGSKIQKTKEFVGNNPNISLGGIGAAIFGIQQLSSSFVSLEGTFGSIIKSISGTVIQFALLNAALGGSTKISKELAEIEEDVAKHDERKEKILARNSARESIEKEESNISQRQKNIVNLEERVRLATEESGQLKPVKKPELTEEQKSAKTQSKSLISRNEELERVISGGLDSTKQGKRLNASLAQQQTLKRQAEQELKGLPKGIESTINELEEKLKAGTFDDSDKKKLQSLQPALKQKKEAQARFQNADTAIKNIEFKRRALAGQDPHIKQAQQELTSNQVSIIKLEGTKDESGRNIREVTQQRKQVERLNQERKARKESLNTQIKADKLQISSEVSGIKGSEKTIAVLSSTVSELTDSIQMDPSELRAMKDNVKRSKGKSVKGKASLDRLKNLQKLQLGGIGLSVLGTGVASGFAESGEKNLLESKGRSGETKFIAGSALATAGQQAGTFAAVGAAFGPHGALIGGLVGAGFGLVQGITTGLNKVQKVLSEARLEESAKKLSRVIEDLNNPDIKLAPITAKKQFQETFKLTEREFSIRRDPDSKDRVENLAGVTQTFLHDFARSLKEIDNEKTQEENIRINFERFQSESSDLLAGVARHTGQSIQDLEKNFQRTITQNIKSAKVLSVVDPAQRREDTRAIEAQGLINVIADTSIALGEFEAILNREVTDLSGVFNRLGQVADAKLFGRALNQSAARTSVFGESSEKFIQEANTINSIGKQLPNIIVDVFSQSKGKDDFGDLFTLFQDRLGKILPDSREVPEVNFIRSAITSSIGELEGRDDIAKHIQTNLDQILGPVQDKFKQFGQIQIEQSQLQLKIISSLSTQFKRINELNSQALELDFSNIELTEEKQTRNTINNRLTVEESRKFDTQKLKLISGGETDVGGLGVSLRASQQKIEEIVKEISVSPTDNLKTLIEARQREETNIERVTKALRFMADATSRAAKIEEEISREKQLRETKFSLVKEFAFGSPESRRSLGQQVTATNIATKTGTLSSIPVELRQSVLSILERFGEGQVGATGLTGNEHIRKLTEDDFRRSGGVKAFGGEENAKRFLESLQKTQNEGKLEQERNTIFKQAIAANTELSTTFKSEASRLSSIIEKEFPSFVENMKLVFLRQQENTASTDAAKLKGRLGVVESQRGKVEELKDLLPGDFKNLNETNVRILSKIIPQIEERQKITEQDKKLKAGPKAESIKEQIISDKRAGEVISKLQKDLQGTLDTVEINSIITELKSAVDTGKVGVESSIAKNVRKLPQSVIGPTPGRFIEDILGTSGFGRSKTEISSTDLTTLTNKLITDAITRQKTKNTESLRTLDVELGNQLNPDDIEAFSKGITSISRIFTELGNFKEIQSEGNLAKSYQRLTQEVDLFEKPLQDLRNKITETVLKINPEIKTVIESLAPNLGIGIPPIKRNKGGSIGRFAGGGIIPGSGPNRDTELAYLTKGEYVIQRPAVEAIGLDNLHALNAMTRNKGGIIGFNKGGEKRYIDPPVSDSKNARLMGISDEELNSYFISKEKKNPLPSNRKPLELFAESKGKKLSDYQAKQSTVKSLKDTVAQAKEGGKKVTRQDVSRFKSEMAYEARTNRVSQKVENKQRAKDYVGLKKEFETVKQLTPEQLNANRVLNKVGMGLNPKAIEAVEIYQANAKRNAELQKKQSSNPDIAKAIASDKARTSAIRQRGLERIAKNREENAKNKAVLPVIKTEKLTPEQAKTKQAELLEKRNIQRYRDDVNKAEIPKDAFQERLQLEEERRLNPAKRYTVADGRTRRNSTFEQAKNVQGNKITHISPFKREQVYYDTEIKRLDAESNGKPTKSTRNYANLPEVGRQSKLQSHRDLRKEFPNKKFAEQELRVGTARLDSVGKLQSDLRNAKTHEDSRNAVRRSMKGQYFGKSNDFISQDLHEMVAGFGATKGDYGQFNTKSQNKAKTQRLANIEFSPLETLVGGAISGLFNKVKSTVDQFDLKSFKTPIRRNTGGGTETGARSTINTGFKPINVSIDKESLSSLELAIKEFSTPAMELASALNSMPKEITLSAQYKIDVFINGTEAFKSMDAQFSKLVVEGTRTELNKLIDAKFPTVGRV